LISPAVGRASRAQACRPEKAGTQKGKLMRDGQALWTGGDSKGRAPRFAIMSMVLQPP